MSERAAALAYRTMVAGEAGRPECGVGSRRRPLLGVRRGIDVFPNVNGWVEAGGQGGMSVAPSPGALPPHYRPERHGGTSRLPCWSLDLASLPAALQHITTSATHGLIRSAKGVSLHELQAVLCSTASNWDRIPGEPTT